MHTLIPFILVVGTTLAPIAAGSSFSAADTQLTERDIGNFKAIAFASSISILSSARTNSSRCKAFPGDQSWPTADEWSRLNTTLGGVLLNPLPAASVCYPTSPAFNSAACNFLFTNASSTSFYLDDPLTSLNLWPQGNTCIASRTPTGNCTQGGYPVYVVNATSVKHVQAAVNFARNKNIRLVIKNTGHDSVGRNVGAGSLSVWTHYLRGFELLPSHKQPGVSYRGTAARVGSGLQVWDAFGQSARSNITLPAASCLTVGSYGGWFTGGGHSPLSSTYGLGVDQVLSLDVVTADGRYVTASPTANQDLFFAVRGGGGSTYGIVTSAIVKAHPSTNLTIASFTFTLNPSAPPTPVEAPSPAATIASSSAFWAGFNAVFAFGAPVADAGGYLWTNGIKVSNTSYLMQVRAQMVGISPPQAAAFVQPLLATLNALGIPVSITTPTTTVYAQQPNPSTGGGPGNSRFASRLFPRASWDNATLFNATMTAAREAVEAGYTFHGLNMSPTKKVAATGGELPLAGVNPVWRDAVMHADVFDTINMATATPAEADAANARLNGVMDKIRAATPGGGAYFNEAGGELEPDWQHSFFGTNYDKLLKVKRERDPWGVFWAPATVGSESWAVELAVQGGLKNQNGRLCRV
ncbi:hypothetical protein B0T17DRAFT_495718 [Bombardia bombarda]|uniref:FAD-binding PCMH-type domain-containing protein n=1 Tax=Bombardia bombarda TaxID=252184 RepID=A0AA39WLS9_9PEZI|nr:hypothetical protein B0T17DRAFT_495718 [Bombardia bombarda]